MAKQKKCVRFFLLVSLTIIYLTLKKQELLIVNLHQISALETIFLYY